MPALYRTILPRIRKSLQTHGVFGTLKLSFRAPFRLLRERREVRRLYASRLPDPFDLEHNVETSQRIHPSDLRIESPNWIHGYGYWPTTTEVVHEILAALPMQHERFTFIDLGSGKGRVLLMASEYPFERIVGVEYAPDLHRAALENIRRYRSDRQKCRNLEAICQDMTAFELPDKPLVLFLYNPASEAVLRIVAENIVSAAAGSPREIWVAYVTPSPDLFAIFERGTLRKVKVTNQYAIYSNC
jgi:hypothetical protein